MRIRGFDLGEEVETARGWSYALALVFDELDGTGRAPLLGERVELSLTLSWVDHDHITGGAIPPSRTVRAVLDELLASGVALRVPRSLDVATIRRLVPELDERVRGRLTGSGSRPEQDA